MANQAINTSKVRATQDSLNAPINLEKRVRFGEGIIQGLLLFCGILSIFTSIAIVGVLGRESLIFFTEEHWGDARFEYQDNGQVKSRLVQLEAQLDAPISFFEISSGTPAIPLVNEQVIRVGNEEMRIKNVSSNILDVQRGYNGSLIESHDSSAPIQWQVEGDWVEATDEAGTPLTIPRGLNGISTSIAIPEGSTYLFKVGDTIRIDNEDMRIENIEARTMTVRRGYNRSALNAHSIGAIVQEVKPPISIKEFITGTTWQPHNEDFGVLSLVSATLTTSFIAMLVALPLGVGAAIYLSEYASLRTRSTVKPILEVLAGIPTVVYGYFALTFVSPIVRDLFSDIHRVGTYNMLSAGAVMGIMILPTVASMSEDALQAVPDSLRQAAYGLGSNKLETSLKVVVPAALSGIVAAFILGMSRAVGETMIVAIASGAGPNFSFNPLEAAETMTGHIVRISTGDLGNDIDFTSLFAIGLTLFLVTLVLNVISRQIVHYLREAYE